jgi:putative oxidoreductase
MSTFKSTDNTVPDATRGSWELTQGSGLRNATELGGRALLAVLFLASGLGKIPGYAATAGYMAAVGVPSALLPAAIALEVFGAIAIIAGWKTRITALLLAGYTLVAALIFHSNFSDQIQVVMFMKNVSITGGLLLLVANGAGPWSLDGRKATVTDTANGAGAGSRRSAGVGIG